MSEYSQQHVVRCIWQVAAFKEVQQGSDVLLASHTGSGKTLAYLLPLVRGRRGTANLAAVVGTCGFFCAQTLGSPTSAG